MKYFLVLLIVMNTANAFADCVIGVCTGDRVLVYGNADTQARVMSVSQNNHSVSVKYLDNEQEGNIESNVSINSIIRTERDLNGFNAGETVLYINPQGENLSLVEIVGKNPDDSFRIKLLEGNEAGKITDSFWHSLKKMQGCESGHCVNDTVLIRSKGTYLKTKIVALKASREYFVQILEGQAEGAVVSRANTYYDFAKIKGCIKGGFFQKDICVGTTAKLKGKSRQDVRVVGIRDDGKFVVEHLNNTTDSLRSVNRNDLDL